MTYSPKHRITNKKRVNLSYFLWLIKSYFFWLIKSWQNHVLFKYYIGLEKIRVETGVSTPTSEPTHLPIRSDNQPTQLLWRVSGGSPPPESEIGGSVDRFEHENLKRTDLTILHQKKSLFSIDGSISPVVLVRLVEKWRDLIEIRPNLVKIRPDLVQIRWISSDSGGVL